MSLHFWRTSQKAATVENHSWVNHDRRSVWRRRLLIIRHRKHRTRPRSKLSNSSTPNCRRSPWKVSQSSSMMIRICTNGMVRTLTCHCFPLILLSLSLVGIFGPPDTLYEGGYFKADMEFPTTYPFAPPKVSSSPTDWQVRSTRYLGKGKYQVSCSSLFLGWLIHSDWHARQSILIVIGFECQSNRALDSSIFSDVVVGWQHEYLSSERS